MKPFKFDCPNITSVPIVASIPHAGEAIPTEIGNLMFEKHFRFPYHTDWHVDQLFNFLPELGIPVLSATYSRYVVDLNRKLNDPIFGTFQDSPIFSHTSDGQPLYHTIPDDATFEERIKDFYTPYHSKLTEILENTRNQFGKAFLIDLHSFRSHYLPNDVCLGNRSGTTCSPDFYHRVRSVFSKHGLTVADNNKFIGGHITSHYANIRGVETLQIELRRAFYLKSDELTQNQRPSTNTEKFNTARLMLKSIFSSLVKIQETP